MQILINGVPIVYKPQSLTITDTIGQRSTCAFTILDELGLAQYLQGQPVSVLDDSIPSSPVLIYTGFIQSSKRATPSSYTSLLEHQITAIDPHYLADKRIAATSYANQTCGFIVNDLAANYLDAEGVCTLNNLFSVNQSTIETDTTGFTTNNGSTVSRTTSQHWQGAAALQVACPGSVTSQGFKANIPASALAAGQLYTLSLYLSGTGNIDLRAQNNDTGNTLGSIVPLTLTGPGNWIRISTTFACPNPIPASGINLRVGTNGTQNITYYADGIQMEQSDQPTPWVVGQTSYVQAGPTLTSYIVNYKKVSACLDELATLAGFYWNIDANRNLHFAAYSTNLASWICDGTQVIDGSAVLENTSPLYRNGQWMLGAAAVTTSQTETQKGDGSKRVFQTSYPIHQVPSNIHIDAGGAQTIGILGVDTGKQWYWNKGQAQVTQDNSGTVLTSANVLSISYIGEYPAIAYSGDTAQQTLQQAIEGGNTTGLVEDVQADASLVTTAQAFQSGAALLAKYATNGTIFTFLTNMVGLAAGQLLTVNLPDPWQFTGQTVLIESITITFDDFMFWFDVKALDGPVNSTWVQFFQALADTQFAVDTSLGGASATVAILAAFTMAFTWAMSYTATVTVCPMFPFTFPVTFC